MSEERSKVVEALRQGALNSKNQYVTVRRENLLLALGMDESAEAKHASATDNAQRTTDKQR